MCILLKLDYAKFGVSNLYFAKVIEEKPLGSRLDPPSPPPPPLLVKEGLWMRFFLGCLSIKVAHYCKAHQAGKVNREALV